MIYHIFLKIDSIVLNIESLFFSMTSSIRISTLAIVTTIIIAIISIGICIFIADVAVVSFEIFLSFLRIQIATTAVCLLLLIEILLKECILLSCDCLLHLETILVSFLVLDNLITKLVHLLQHLERLRKISNIWGISVVVVALSLSI